MFVSTSGGAGYSNSTKIAGKPNWTCAPLNDGYEQSMGIVTDLGFIEGYLSGVKSKGPQQIYLRECACPNLWEERGYTGLAKRNNFDLTNLMEKDPWEYTNGEIINKELDGVIYKELALQAPIAAPDSFLVSLAKFKTHGMGVTGAVKNLQGTAARRLHSFCSTADAFRSLPQGYHRYFQPNYFEKIGELHKKHAEAGFPRWNEPMARSPFNTGFYMEQWVHRACDIHSVIPAKTRGISVIEGIYWRDGDGFALGPHSGKAMDMMCNMSLFGIDPFRLDIIAHWLAGHEPGNFGLFHIGIERGLSNVLDPFDIPVYIWKNGKAKKTKLNKLKRTPLLMYYNQKEGEERFHMCDEPFDYKSWKTTGKIAAIEPSIRAIGTDSNGHVVMDLKTPNKGDVYVDILNSKGELLHRMYADCLEPGNHQVVWDGFASPGMYNAYIKGMEWDAERQLVIYT
jgi:hypothetical protein